MEDVHKKLNLGPKQHFWAEKRTFWAIGAEKRPAERPNGHLPKNRSYPELPQDTGDLLSLWSQIRRNPKNGGYIGVAKNNAIPLYTENITSIQIGDNLILNFSSMHFERLQLFILQAKILF